LSIDKAKETHYGLFNGDQVTKDEDENVRCKLGYPNMFVVDSVGWSGSLVLFWNNDISVTIENFSHRHINGVIEILGGVENWKFTGFYGHPDVAKRHEAWALLRYLATLSPHPWVCIGDFNEIVENTKKWGGGGRSNSQMNAFRQALEDCDLTDLGYRGPKFTWCNFREEENFIKERLDRGVANSVW
jgi:hypothetical protein